MTEFRIDPRNKNPAVQDPRLLHAHIAPHTCRAAETLWMRWCRVAVSKCGPQATRSSLPRGTCWKYLFPGLTPGLLRQELQGEGSEICFN